MRPLSELPLFGQRKALLSPAPRQPSGTGYPNVPGFKTGDTSSEAAGRMASVAKTLRARALACLARQPGGLTADEVAAELGASPFAVRPRITDSSGSV